MFTCKTHGTVPTDQRGQHSSNCHHGEYLQIFGALIRGRQLPLQLATANILGMAAATALQLELSRHPAIIHPAIISGQQSNKHQPSGGGGGGNLLTAGDGNIARNPVN